MFLLVIEKAVAAAFIYTCMKLTRAKAKRKPLQLPLNITAEEIYKDRAEMKSTTL